MSHFRAIEEFPEEPVRPDLQLIETPTESTDTDVEQAAAPDSGIEETQAFVAAVVPTAPIAKPLAWDLIVDRGLVVVNVVAFLCGLAILAEAPWGLRPYCSVFLLLLGPGSGLVRPFPNLAPALRCSLAVGLSLACSVLIAQILLATHTMEMLPGAAALTVLTAVGLFVPFRRKSR